LTDGLQDWINWLLAEGIISQADAADMLMGLPAVRVIPHGPATFKERRAARNLEKYINAVIRADVLGKPN
jgi:hypothetical protein